MTIPFTNHHHLLNQSQKWLYSFLFGLGLSIIGFVSAWLIVYVKNSMRKSSFNNLLRVLYSLACGSLLGDAVIHILGETYTLKPIDTNLVSIILLGSIVFFLILDKSFEKCGIGHSHGVIEHSHDIPSLHQNPEAEGPPKPIDDRIENFQDWTNKSSIGYMNILGSLIHNMMDGLMIGFSFASGNSDIYTPTLIAMVAHEIPREIGDVAVLLESGFKDTQILICNASINILALIGIVVGLLTSTMSMATQKYMMVFVAGNFLYISSDIWRKLFKAGWKIAIIEFFTFAGAISLMMGIRLVEAGSRH